MTNQMFWWCNIIILLTILMILIYILFFSMEKRKKINISLDVPNTYIRSSWGPDGHSFSQLCYILQILPPATIILHILNWHVWLCYGYMYSLIWSTLRIKSLLFAMKAFNRCSCKMSVTWNGSCLQFFSNSSAPCKIHSFLHIEE